MPNVAVSPDDLIPTSKVAALLGRDVATVARWVRDGRLIPVAQAPGLRGARLFSRADIERLRDRTAAS